MDYRDDSVWLMQGDCLERMKEIPDESVDLILCDLPYGTTYADFDSVLKNMTKYKKRSIIDLSELWDQYRRMLVTSGSVVLFGAQPFTSALVSSNVDWYKYSWVWLKNKAANHVAVKFQPLKVHEDILVFSPCGCNTGSSNPIKYNPQGVIWGKTTRVRKKSIKKSGTFKYNSLSAGEYQIEGTNYPKSVLEFNVPSGKDRTHPTQKPVDLIEYLVNTYSNEMDVVLDNTMGSGTTGVACRNLNRNFIGIELDEKYFEIAKRRILG